MYISYEPLELASSEYKDLEQILSDLIAFLEYMEDVAFCDRRMSDTERHPARLSLGTMLKMLEKH